MSVRPHPPQGDPRGAGAMLAGGSETSSPGPGPGRRIAAPDADLMLWPRLLTPAEAEGLFATLRREIAWRQHRVRIGAREWPSPRLSAWHGDPGARYRYSGLSLDPLPWTPGTTRARAVVQAVAGCVFNAVLLNLYRDGNDGMGWHADDEPELGPEPVIASLSLGAPRRFVLRHRRAAVPRLDLELGSGALLVMRGPTQRFWRHGVPKTRRAVGERINLTFRRVFEVG